MKIRKATSKDAKGIAKVLVQSYNIKNFKEGIDVFKSETIKSHNYIVAEDNLISDNIKSSSNGIISPKNKIIGIVTWLVHGLPKHQLCELDRIAVIQEYKGKGVAKALFNSLVKDAKLYYKKNNSKLRKLYLLTHADNIRAHKFYEKLGFKHETTLKEHYYKGKDEFVFSIFY